MLINIVSSMSFAVIIALLSSFVRSGIVKNISSNSLSSLDAGSWYHESFKTERIPLFTNVVEYCRANEIWMNIELKASEDDMRFNEQRMDFIGRTVASLTAALFHTELTKDTTDYRYWDELSLR